MDCTIRCLTLQTIVYLWSAPRQSQRIDIWAATEAPLAGEDTRSVTSRGRAANQRPMICSETPHIDIGCVYQVATSLDERVEDCKSVRLGGL